MYLLTVNHMDPDAVLDAERGAAGEDAVMLQPGPLHPQHALQPLVPGRSLLHPGTLSRPRLPRPVQDLGV